MKTIKLTTFCLLLITHSYTCSAEQEPPITQYDFTLMAHSGEVSPEDFRGTVVLLYFGFTSCPDICPTSLARMAAAYQMLDDDQQQKVQPLFITLDPDRDTTETMHDYVQYFTPDMIGLTGSIAQIKKVAANYRIVFRKTAVDNSMGYVVDHSSVYFILASDGSLYSHLLHNASVEDIASKVKHALKDV